MTKKQALEITRDLWTWLEKTGSSVKGDWPGWNQVGGMHHNCPCCHLVLEQLGVERSWPDDFTPMKCASNVSMDETNWFAWHSLCPLKSLWPNGCEAEGPFRGWDDANGCLDRRHYAAEIRDAAIAELEKMKL